MNKEFNELVELGRLAETLFGAPGYYLHTRYLNYLNTGSNAAGLLKNYESEQGQGLPDMDSLERSLGGIADDIKLLDRGDLERLSTGEYDHIEDIGKKPDLDLSRPGETESNGSLGTDRHYYFYGEDSWERGGSTAISCGKLWEMYLMCDRQAESCTAIDFKNLYRGALLRALAEAYRVCVPTHCEKALAWIQYCHWDCTDGKHPFRQYNGPYMWCTLKLAVICTAI